MKKTIILPSLLFLVCAALHLFGQKPAMELSFTAAHNGYGIPLNSIHIENLTQGGDTTLFYPNTVLVLCYEGGIGECSGPGDEFLISQNNPNPFRDETSIHIYLTKRDYIRLSLANLLGQRVGLYENTLEAGHHSFTFYPGKDRFYILSARVGGFIQSIKMICTGKHRHALCRIVYAGKNDRADLIRKYSHVSSGFKYSPDDTLFFTGFTAMGQSAIMDKPEGDKTYLFELYPLIPCNGISSFSYLGITYQTVTIGEQCWMWPNLDAGVKIPSTGDQANNGIIEKYCYADDPSNCTNYGGLYQWNEMMSYSNIAGAQGICPDGWHIPTDGEWCVMENEVDAGTVDCVSYDWRGSDGGGNLKETGMTHWLTPNTGATNSSGFTALPGGYWYDQYAFYDCQRKAYFWTSSQVASEEFLSRSLGYNTARIYRGPVKSKDALSVRCTKNMLPAMISTQITDITYTAATAGGVITDVGMYPVISKGVCYALYENPTLNDPHTVDGNGASPYVSRIKNLNPLTIYYVRAYATNQAGTGYGNQMTFITADPVPVLTTSQVVNIGPTTATGGGNVIDEGMYPVIARGICWNTSGSPTIADPHTTDGSGPGIFESQITGLMPVTPYYVRTYATNQAGTGYGNQAEFVTKSMPCPGIPTITYGDQVYQTVQIGEQCWLRDNLNIGTMIHHLGTPTNNGVIEKYCYSDDTSLCKVYGGLYRWDEMMQYVTQAGAQGICPGGWHVPTKSEWTILIDLLGGLSVAGKKMKEAGTVHWNSPNNADNSSGFTALPGGYYLFYNSFFELHNYAYFWTSENHLSSSSYFYSLYRSSASIWLSSTDLTWGYSVRCLKTEVDPLIN